MTFRIGQKVVCVDAGPSWRGKPVALVKGRIYTIVSFGPFPDMAGDRGVIVDGASGIDDIHHSPEFRTSRFRPAAERKTDISVFTAMLKTERTPAVTSAERGGV